MQGQVIVKLENIPLRNSRARSGKSSWRTSSRQNCESTHKITYFFEKKIGVQKNNTDFQI